MKAIFSFAALLVVLAIVAVNVRNELRTTTTQLAPAAASAPGDAASQASAPFGGSSSPSVAQFQQELGKTMHTVDDRAASAGAEADETK